MASDAENSRKEAFTVSMVDLFGCGFISAIFLFVANMLQPIIDSQHKGTAEIESAFGGRGLSGPVVLTIESSGPITISDWPKKAENLPGPGEKFATILSDASKIDWPLKISFLQSGQNDPIDVMVTLTMGSHSAVGYLRQFAGVKDVDRATVYFNWKGELNVSIASKMSQELKGEIIPVRSSRGYSTKFYLAANTDWHRSYILWKGDMISVAVGMKGQTPYVMRGQQTREFCGVSLGDNNVVVPCDNITGEQQTQINQSISRAIVYVCRSNSDSALICAMDS